MTNIEYDCNGCVKCDGLTPERCVIDRGRATCVSCETKIIYFPINKPTPRYCTKCNLRLHSRMFDKHAIKITNWTDANVEHT